MPQPDYSKPCSFVGAEPLENAHKTTTVVFDKTGTITHGKSSVSYLGLVQNISLCRLLAILGAAENTSEHPLGRAIVAFVKNALALEEITAKAPKSRTGKQTAVI